MIVHSVKTETIPYIIQDDGEEVHYELKNVDPAEAANLERCVQLVIESYYVGSSRSLIETAIEVYKRYGSVVLPDGRILKDIAWAPDE